MSKNFIIVESPTKARTLDKFLKGEYFIEASMGHIRDLPEKKFGVTITGDEFLPEYTLSPRGKKILETLKSKAKQCERIYLATDPDREGEAIAWHIYELLKKINSNIERIEFHEITKKAILSAIDNSTHINIDRVNAQQARRILDRIVGYKLSPILWQILSKGLSAGRVQSVAVRIVCDREEEIQNFKSEEYWKIKVTLLTESKDSIEFELIKDGPKKIKIENAEQAEKICSILPTADYQIEKINRKKQLKKPQPPLITSRLQQLASQKFNFTPVFTMRVAQELYEGIAISPTETVGLITYMRTDSIRVSDEAKAMAADYIKEKFGEKYLPEADSKFKQSGQKVQDAHEAIRPTDIYLSPKKLEKVLSKEQLKIYRLIWEIFLASQMRPAEFDVTSITVLADKKYLFTAKGSIMTFDGCYKIHQGDSQKDVVLPQIKDDERMLFEKLLKSQHFTKPPARYTEATLVKELEDKGIGRPSTYASIISTITTRKYIIKEEKQLKPTELGKIVNKFLVENFSDVLEVGFTASMEAKLDNIENEGIDWQKTLKDFYVKFINDIGIVGVKVKQLKNDMRQETEFKCEKCGAFMILKMSEKGKFIACPNYPTCKNIKAVSMNGTKIEIQEDKKLDELCPDCGGHLILKNGKFGKFITCSNYPKCTFKKSPDIGIPCQNDGCSGCSNYPKCNFTEWHEIVQRPCPKCENKYLIVSSATKEKLKIKCPKPDCDHTEEEIIETRDND